MWGLGSFFLSSPIHPRRFSIRDAGQQYAVQLDASLGSRASILGFEIGIWLSIIKIEDLKRIRLKGKSTLW
ncbi:hypothetical protein MRB53_014681 [Persea americana]|uniref:Uncharacterized protein n=1 Tax=Persea americana TaxID=3435 RepID=A0ACC2KBJ3_PERAE|nr:hypothetical protein MRB53_014681 [Persea americana]